MEHKGTAQFDIFVSYNSADEAVAKEIVRLLGARGLRPWFDKEQLMPGGLWQDALEEALGTVRCTAVLVGPGGLGPWQRPEMRAAIDESVRRRLPVIPVLLPGGPKRPKLPLFLRGFTWADLRGGLTADGLDSLQRGITRAQVPAGGSEKPGERPRALVWVAIIGLVVAVVFGLKWLIASATSYPLPEGAVSWWHGEDNADDALGSNNGRIEAGVTFAEGKVKRAFLFNGGENGGGVSLGNASALQFEPNSSFTMEAWVQRFGTSRGGDGQVIIILNYECNSNSPTSQALAIWQDGTPYFDVRDVSKNGGIITFKPLSAYEWHHIAGVRQVTGVNKLLKLYIDGKLVNFDTDYSTGAIASTAADVDWIGRRHRCGANNTFFGLIDEPAIYGRALSDQEIEGIFKAGSAGKRLNLKQWAWALMKGLASPESIMLPACPYASRPPSTATHPARP